MKRRVCLCARRCAEQEAGICTRAGLRANAKQERCTRQRPIFRPQRLERVSVVQSRECSQRRDCRRHASEKGCLAKIPAAGAPSSRFAASLQSSGRRKKAWHRTSGHHYSGGRLQGRVYITMIFDRHAKLPIDAGSVPFSTGSVSTIPQRTVLPGR